MLCISYRYPEDKSPGLRPNYHIIVQVLHHMDQAVHCQMQPIRILKDTGHIPENDSQLRKIRYASHILFQFLHLITSFLSLPFTYPQRTRGPTVLPWSFYHYIILVSQNTVNPCNANSIAGSRLFSMPVL